MKKAIILTIILLLILSAGISEHFFVHKTFDCFKEQTRSIENAINEDDIETALEKSEALLDWWNKKRVVIEAISYCQDARQVNVVIGEMIGSLKCGDIENASSKIVSLNELTDNIRDILDFNAIDII